MKSRPVIASLIALAFALVSASSPRAQNIQGREVFGIRLGGVVAQGALGEKFGDGSEIELHFIHGVAPWLGVDVSLSSHNFGPSKDRDTDILFTGLNSEVNLQIFSVTAGMIALATIGKRLVPTIEAGPGLYSANTSLPQGFYEVSKTDNHFGLYTGVGLLVRITNSFSASGSFKYHHVFVGNDAEDTIPFYTGESDARFFQISVGIMITTG